MHVKTKECYDEFIEKAKEKQKASPLIPLHIHIMFEMKEEKNILAKKLIENFEGSAADWDLLLNSRVFYYSDDNIVKFRKNKLKKLGLCCPYENGQQIGQTHYIVSLNINNLSIDVNVLLNIFKVINFDSYDFKQIFLSNKEETDYFNDLSIAYSKNGSFYLYDRLKKEKILENKNLNKLMEEIKVKFLL